MFKIFPATITNEGSKVPLIHNWNELATNDPQQIQAWQNQFGAAIRLWGIPCGSKNGIVAVDIDVKNGKNGFKSLEKEGLVLPPTMSQTTMSGGKHFIYKCPPGLTLKNTSGTFGEAIDTRAERGWIAYYGTDNTPIADAPAWLLLSPKKDYVKDNNPFIIEPAKARDMLDAICNDIVNAPPGEANNTMNLKSFEAAQNLIGTGSIPQEEVFERLYQAGRERGKPDYEIRATIHSGFEAGLRVNPTIVCPFDEDDKKPTVMVFEQKESWTPKQMTPEQMMNWDKLRRPQIFEHWSTEDIHITTADGGVGKSTLTLYEAVCLAIGAPFLGFKCLQPGGKTLFITGEDEAEKLMAIVGKICEQMQLTVQQKNTVMSSVFIKKDADLCVVSRDKSGFYQPNHKALEMVMEACLAIKPKYIVLDPIASFWGSEAALNDMSKAVAKFAGLLVSKTNACIHMLNHMGKSSSQNKDMSQFAGRGGSALPSHSRVSRVMRKVDKHEYLESTGKQLEDREKAMLIAVSKFSDGSPILDVPFLVVRTGYLFEQRNMVNPIEENLTDVKSDVEIVFDFIKSCRDKNKYPTKSLVVAMVKPHMSRERAVAALQVLSFEGYEDRKIKYIASIDLLVKEQMIVITDLNDEEIIK